MATEKTLNTRIKLRHDTYDAWHLANPTLLKGEIAIVELPTNPTNKDHGVIPPATLIKVGPGSFNSLPFLSATAADVHAWAKKSIVSYDAQGDKIVFSNGSDDTNPIKFDFSVVTPGELDEIIKNYYTKDQTDNRIAEEIGKLDVTVTGMGKGKTLASLTETDGKIAATFQDIEITKSQISDFDEDDYKAKTNKTFDETLAGAKVLASIKQDADGDVTVTTRDLTLADIGAASAAQGEAADKAAAKLEGIADGETVVDYVADAIAGVTGGDITVDTAKNYDTTTGNIKTKFDAVDKAIADEQTRAEGIEGSLRTDVDAIKGDYLKSADKEALQNQITANANAITTITDGIDPEKIDGLTDLIDWANTHAPEVASIKKDIEDEAARADAEEKRLAGLIEDNAEAIAKNAEDIEANANAITGLNITDGKVAKAAHADDSDKLGGTAAADYLKKSEATGYNDILTKTSAATLYQPAGNYQPAGDYALKSELPTVNDGVLTFIADDDALEIHTGEGKSRTFSANQAGNTSIDLRIAEKGITTGKIADHAVGAAQIKAEQGYNGADAEVWVFDCGGAQ